MANYITQEGYNKKMERGVSTADFSVMMKMRMNLLFTQTAIILTSWNMRKSALKHSTTFRCL